MTTAHKPTFHPAIGSANQGGYRYGVAREQRAARDENAHMKMKYRAMGQGSAEELAARDLMAELEFREQKHNDQVDSNLRRKGLLNSDSMELANGTKPLALENIDLDKFADSDDSDSSDDSSSSDEDEDDDEEQIKRELRRIKLEREKERKELLARKKAEEASKTANPLIYSNTRFQSETFTKKRDWLDDTPFKNQAMSEQPRKKRFINDTIRNDFHRKFMSKYVH